MSTGQVWRTFTLGVTMWSPALSKVLRVVVQPLVKFRQFADVKDAAVQGKGKGKGQGAGVPLERLFRRGHAWHHPHGNHHHARDQRRIHLIGD